MSEKILNQMVAKTFLDLAHTLETGETGARPSICITALDSEHGEDNIIEAALTAKKAGVDPIVIGASKEVDGIKVIPTSCVDDAHKKMEELLTSGQADGAVTMHYPFPIGIATVGRVVTPGKGSEMFIATTTGTSSTDRVEGMIKNAIYGIITAKACGIKNPTVGILNVDGARQVEKALMELKAGGYDINFTESKRADGGVVMRGNDLLTGAADIMVTDSLTGNILMKMFSAYQTGGSYESLGYGYGPGIGEGFDKIIMIISRASGAPVVANAMKFAGELVKGNLHKVAKEEFKKAGDAGLKKILDALRQKREQSAGGAVTEDIKVPPKEVVTEEIMGIEVMDLEDAVKVLWKEGIYAESGMGCTGPVVLMSEANYEKSRELLVKSGYIS